MAHESPKRLVFVGGGHAHVQAVKELAKQLRRSDNVSTILIADQADAYYSGMLPGCLAGLYAPEEIQIHLPPLCEWCGTEFILATVVSIDLEHRVVWCRRGETSYSASPPGASFSVPYDILSINVGSATRGSDMLKTHTNAIATRPISELLAKVSKFEETHMQQWRAEHHVPAVVVIGAGPAGVELAFAFRTRFETLFGKVQVTLVDRETDNVMRSYGWWTSKNIESKLAERNIRVVKGRTAVGIESNRVLLRPTDDTSAANVTSEKFDLLVLATGAAPPMLLSHTGLALDAAGFIRVSTTLQTVTAPNVFAVGDCCSIDNHPEVAKAGVYAVREGPVLAENLLRFVRGQPLKHYSPQSGFLALMMTGDGEAIGSWKGASLKGVWMWKLKDRIDRNFMALFDTRKLGKSSAMDRIPSHTSPNTTAVSDYPSAMHPTAHLAEDERVATQQPS